MTEGNFAEDPALQSEEKELSLRVNKADKTLVVHSEIASVCKALLSREDFTERNRRTVDGNVTAVTGELPMGVLKVQKNARQHGSFSRIVASHD